MSVPNRILLALDTSVCASAASKVALQLAKSMPVQLTAVHVVNVTTATGNTLYDITHRLGFEPAVVSDAVFSDHISRGEKLLAEFEALAREQGVEVTTRLSVGAVGLALQHAARHTDLMIVGLRGETEDRFPGQGGSRVASFLDQITVPVLVVPKGIESIGTVALGYDGSVGAAHAVTAVRRFFTALGVTVHAIHIGDEGSILHECDPELAPLKVVHHVISGTDPHEALARTAHEDSAEVLALGFRGQSKMKDFLFGSATEFIVLNTELALLVTH